MLGKILGYGTIAAGSFAAGYYRAHCKKSGVELPTLADIALTYGIPAVSSFGAGVGEAVSNDSGELGLFFGFLGGATMGGLASIVCETAGYVTGNLVGK